MKHRFKSIEGAVRKIRKLEALNAWYEDQCQIMNKERRLLAKLAAKTPQFSNPIVVFEAEKIRDRILSQTNK